MEEVVARQHLGLIHRLSADRAAVVESTELISCRVLKTHLEIAVGAEKVHVREQTLLQRLKQCLSGARVGVGAGAGVGAGVEAGVEAGVDAGVGIPLLSTSKQKIMIQEVRTLLLL